MSAITAAATLSFLADESKVQKTVLGTAHSSEARFGRRDGRLVIEYVNSLWFANTCLHSWWSHVPLGNFVVPQEDRWRDEWDDATKTSTLTRGAYVFAKRARNHEAQVEVATKAGEQALRIDALVLGPKGPERTDCLCKYSPSTPCYFSNQFSDSDFCVATDAITQNIHLLVITSPQKGHFTITSYMAKTSGQNQ